MMPDGDAAAFPGKVLVGSPPATAIGGVANHTRLLVSRLPDVRWFDQWWPVRERSDSRAVRMGLHVLGLGRWASALGSWRPDVVHLQVTSPGLPRDALYVRMARIAKVPVVAHLHTSGFLDDAATLDRLRTVAAGCAGIVVMSESVKSDLVQVLPEVADRTWVVPNPAPEFDAAPAPGHGVRANAGISVLCVGQVSKEKGQLPLARSIARLRAEGVDVGLVVVGPDALSDHDRAALDECPGTVVVGPLRGEQLQAACDAADLFALFSRTEAEPLSILEAMSRGLPVVGTRTGSVPDLLAGPGVGNVVVEVDDDTALTDALRLLCADPARLVEIGRGNREWVRTHRTLAGHVAALSAVYEQVTRG